MDFPIHLNLPYRNLYGKSMRMVNVFIEANLLLNIRKLTNELEVSYWITNFAGKKRIKVINPFLCISFYTMDEEGFNESGDREHHRVN